MQEPWHAPSGLCGFNHGVGHLELLSSMAKTSEYCYPPVPKYLFLNMKHLR